MHTQTMDDDHSFDMCNIYSAWHGMARHGAGHVRHTTGNTRKFHIDYEWRGFRMQTKNSHRYYGKKKIVTKYCYISFKCAQRGHITHSKWIPNVILVKHTFQTLHFNTSKNTFFFASFFGPTNIRSYRKLYWILSCTKASTFERPRRSVCAL